MELTPGQLLTLAEMGIPVWELRATSHETALSETNTTSIDQALIDRLDAVQCFVVVDNENLSQSAQSLLNAMLRAIQLPIEQVAVISVSQLLQNEEMLFSVSPQKILFILGEAVLNRLSTEPLVFNDCRLQLQQLLASQIPAVVSSTIDALLTTPDNKALVWQDLQLVKSYCQDNVISQ